MKCESKVESSAGGTRHVTPEPCPDLAGPMAIFGSIFIVSPTSTFPCIYT